MNFTRSWSWERFVPNLGENRILAPAQQLVLELGVGLTHVELDAFRKGVERAYEVVVEHSPGAKAAALKRRSERSDEEKALVAAAEAVQLDAMAGALAEAWAPYARMGPGQHAINGKPLASLRDYLRVGFEQRGLTLILEVQEEVKARNSVEGSIALFSARRSGGSASTAAPSSGATGHQTATR